MPTTSERVGAEMERWPARRESAGRTANASEADVTAAKRAKPAEAALTLLLTLSFSAILVIAWLWALAMWYPASSPPVADPNHGCGPMIACLDA